ncbi:MAG: DUF58 domain-containing protein [Anaerolineae bacterium]
MSEYAEPGPGRSTKIALETWLVPILFLVLIITQLLAPYRGWRILIVGLGGAFLLSWFWSRSLAKGMDLTRQMRFGWAQVGDRLVERFTIHNDGWAPAVWAEILDGSTMPDYAVSRGTGISGYDVIRWHTEAICLRRGLFTLGPTKIRTGDPFGIFSVTLDFPASMPLLVLPPIVPLPSIEVAPGGRSGEARPRANILDKTVSAATVREYAPGDSRRWIHWRTTARRDGLYIRQFDSTPAGDWWILLDMDRRVQVGKAENATDEHGVILAASLADRGVRARRAVGMVAEGEELVWMPPAEGEGQRWEILRSLALISRGDRPLAEMLSRVGSSIGRNASLILITPSADLAWVHALVPLIRQGAVPTVLLLDPVSFGGTANQDIVKRSLENLEVVHYEITQDVLDRPEIRPGRRGHWEWRVSGTGKAIAVEQREQQVSWRTLV